MKKNLLFLTVFFITIQIWAQQVQINEASGWLESAFVKWQPVSGAQTYNVYYTGQGVTDKKIDDQLIRSYGNYFRADIPGLQAGTYTVKVKPVISGVEGTGSTTSNLTVIAQDRNGFAFDGGRVPGGYKADGTPKDNAVILYITQNTKNTISMNITGASANPCVGLQNILYAIKKGKDTRPFIIRLIGNITDMTVMEGGDVVIENANNAASYVTIEGVGTDAVANGWGVRIKTASNIEVSNLGFMNCNSTAGDNVGMQQDNDHIWVHNCDLFYGNAGSDADQIKGDGALDNKASTYITLSYNHFWDNGKASLLGLSEGTTTGLYITYHHNWFDHSDSRHPRVRYYSAHIYNNYYDGVSKYGAGSTLGSSLFVEGNYYRNSKHPMMTSLQGSDIWDEANQVNNAGTMGTFSGEDGGSIKAFNNTFDASNGTNNMRFVAYNDPNPLYNISGKISSTTDFDAYVATTRGETVSSAVKSKSGANTYNNFDTNAALYVKNLVVDQPAAAKTKTTQYAGRVSGGDLKWVFDNSVDDTSSLVIAALKSALTNYTGTLVAVQGEGNPPTSSQTLTSTGNNNQTVTSGTAIASIVFTWGGDATDATVTGLPASGISFVKNTTAKTITITGTPTATLSYSIATTGTGTPATGSGTITVTPAGSQTLTSTSNNNQTVASGTAIGSIVFTWGGNATDATVTGLPASGISFVKNTTAKTITITGTPTATLSYSIATTGTGTPATGSGTITVTPAGTQTLTSTSNNNQTVASGTAIGSIVFTWGGNATDATVTGLPASGISFVKNTTAKTITITGTPTATLSYSIATTGTGTPATGSGTITVTTGTPSGDEIHNFTTSGKTSSFYTITGNMNSTSGSVTYAGLTLTARLKIESSTTITYTTTSASTLTLVFDSNFTGTVKVNNVSYTASAGIVTASIPAGSNTITKGSVANLFYISTHYTGGTLRMAQATEVVAEPETTKVILYPNPVADVLYLTKSTQTVEKVQVYNMSGTLVKSAGKDAESIDLSNLIQGTYLVKVYTNDGSFNQTILKK
ncbi:Por secretion system C-terminal sorting domain-containing protein [Flavobacterium aquidurense]|nr:Por secretion system C-terminal sorting domain-containing protein [Flavobacterium aquidurense]